MNRKKTLNPMIVGIAAAGGFLLSGCAPVTVSSTPEGANVYYKNSNKLVGAAPAKVMVYANTREVVVRKDGYFSKTVALSPVGKDRIEVELQRRERVLVLSHPTGAELYVKGREKRVGKTPYLLDYDKPYRTFEVRSPGYANQILEVPEDPEGNLMVELEREQSIMVVSNPKKVAVFDKDGQLLGVTPLAIPATEDCVLELRKEGYYSLEVPVGPETESPFMVELDREPIIIVYSEPADAVVEYRGVTLGKTPYRHLVQEDMSLEISVDRYYTKQITIAPDSPRNIHVVLDPKPYITVQSTPSGAELYRSGGVELIGKTPIEVLVEKDTALEIHKPGFAIKPFMLSPDSNGEVNVPLVRSVASQEKTVVIESDPQGAKVYRPGGAELIGTTPLEQRVRFERTFEIQLDGYETKIVTIAPDSPDSVVFALAKNESTENVTISDPLLNTPSSF